MVKQIAQAIFVFLTVQILLVCPDSVAEQEKFRIGFSQATTTEPWRLLFNRELDGAAIAADFSGLTFNSRDLLCTCGVVNHRKPMKCAASVRFGPILKV